MNASWVSSHGFDLALIGFITGSFGAVALCAAAEALIRAARKFRSADLGDKLLAACAGDHETAQKVIASVTAENDVLVEAARLVFNDDFRRRQAEFNAAAQEYDDGGRRWQLVH